MSKEGSRGKRNVANKVARRKHQILKKLERVHEQRFIRALDFTSVIAANSIQHELSKRVRGTNHGGIGMMMKPAQSTGLITDVHMELEHEDVAELEYKPTTCHRG